MSIHKILFITESPFTFDLNGAASFSTGHLNGLFHAFPTAEFLILHLRNEIIFDKAQLDPFLKDAGFKGTVEIQSLETRQLTFRVVTAISFLKFWFSNYNKKTISVFANMESQFIAAVQKRITEFKPDLIWAEHILPALLITQNPVNSKLVYSHHDFLFRVLKERNQLSLRNYLRSRMLKNIELQLLRRIHYFINGSEIERKFALKINPDLRSFTFPAIYPINRNLKIEETRVPANRIIHIGSFSATANKVGLADFFKHVYPAIKKITDDFELYLIGDRISFEAPELKWVYDEPQIKICGHISQLSTILRPYDIHIAPYSKGTGTRTKLLNALRYHGAVVLFEKELEDFTEFKRGIDLLSADNFNDFANQIIFLIQHPDDRRKIADHAFTALENHFTFHHLSEKIRQLLAA